MANKTISELNELTTVSSDDFLLVETNSETMKVRKSNLLSGIGGGSSNEDLPLVLDLTYNDNVVLQPISVDASTGIFEFAEPLPFGEEGFNSNVAIVPNEEKYSWLNWSILPNEFKVANYMFGMRFSKLEWIDSTHARGYKGSDSNTPITTITNGDCTKYHFELLPTARLYYDLTEECERFKFEMHFKASSGYFDVSFLTKVNNSSYGLDRYMFSSIGYSFFVADIKGQTYNTIHGIGYDCDIHSYGVVKNDNSHYPQHFLRFNLCGNPTTKFVKFSPNWYAYEASVLNGTTVKVWKLS